LQSDKRWNPDGSGRDLYIIRDPSRQPTPPLLARNTSGPNASSTSFDPTRRIDGSRGLHTDGGKPGAALYADYVASLRRRARKVWPLPNALTPTISPQC
jgi:hypothetical protein